MLCATISRQSYQSHDTLINPTTILPISRQCYQSSDSLTSFMTTLPIPRQSYQFHDNLTNPTTILSNSQPSYQYHGNLTQSSHHVGSAIGTSKTLRNLLFTNIVYSISASNQTQGKISQSGILLYASHGLRA